MKNPQVATYTIVEAPVGPPSMHEVGLLVKKGEREDKSDALWLAQVEANVSGIAHRVYPPEETIPQGLYFNVKPEGEYNLHTGEYDINANSANKAYGKAAM